MIGGKMNDRNNPPDKDLSWPAFIVFLVAIISLGYIIRDIGERLNSLEKQVKTLERSSRQNERP